MWIEV